MILETTFLVDLERELQRGGKGAAHRFLETNRGVGLYLSFITAGELAAGSSLARAERWRSFVDGFRVLHSTREVCWEYGKLYRFLQTNRLLIGGNDLWIAATALAHALPLVTRNRRHFERVPGLELVAYD